MIQQSIFLNNLSAPIHCSWDDFLSPEILELIHRVEGSTTDGNYTPQAGSVLRFMTQSLDNAKAIILGQDPYPQEGVATGRAFEVGTLNSWNDKFKNISLKNIVRLLFRTYKGEIQKYNDIKSRMTSDFPILPPQQLFKYWEKEGVLLLNTAFTCEIGQPNSHTNHWAEFTKLLLVYINQKRPDLNWILWGNNAWKVTEGLDLENAFRTFHPMMCYNRPDRELDFLYGKVNPFGDLKAQVDWTGYSRSFDYGVKRGEGNIKSFR